MIRISLIFFLIATPLFAKIQINGKVENYVNKDVFIYSYLNNSEILLSKVSTNSNGDFSYSNDMSYDGIIRLMLADNHASSILFVNNKNIEFTATPQGNVLNFTSISDPENKMYNEYSNNTDYQNKSKLLMQIKELYSPSDAFYNEISKEQQSLSKQYGIDFSKYPFMQYYVNLEQNYLLAQPKDQKEANELNKGILNHLVNDGEDLEKTYLMNQLINAYITYSVSNKSNSVDQISELRKTIDYLLDQTVIETSRGQNVLVSVINLLKGYGLDYIADDYVDEANKLTCTINDGLKRTIEATENTKIGATFPNFQFTEKIKNAKSLYDIKTKYKLVIFWGSFCSVCRGEKPLIKAYYPEFQMKGGEIVSFAIETEKSEYENFVKDIPWYSDTDYLYWSSPLIQKYGIEGTPTMFLLDENNVIIAEGAKIELLKSNVK